MHRSGGRHRVPSRRMPKVYDALKMERSASGFREGLTFEVQQQLGDGIVRCIALGSSDGLRRGHESRQYRGADLGAGGHWKRSGASWTCWVARSTRRARSSAEKSMSIHRNAPEFEELSPRPRAARNRHQGDRFDLSVRQRREGRLVRRRRRGQNRQHDGAHQQHRQSSTAAIRCSLASASARARATTSIMR